MLVQDLASYAETSGFTNVQRFVMQPDPNRCIALVVYGGSAPDDRFGSDAALRENPRVQAQVRGEPNDPEEPSTRAYSLWKALSKQMVTINGRVYEGIVPLQQPFLLRQDALNRWLWVFNLAVKKDVE